MSTGKTVFVLLPGSRDAGDRYQILQEEASRQAAARLGLEVEIAYAPAFDQLRVLKRRLAAGLDAAVLEPASLTTLGFVLRELRGRTGLVLVNAWDPAVESAAAEWGGHPIGTVGTDQSLIGRIQGRQAGALLPPGGRALCVTGPRRSSAARERLEGFQSALGSVDMHDTEAGDWTEKGGETAFSDWYRVFSAREAGLDLIVAQSDELAMGARRAIQSLPASPRKEALGRARLLGVDACPGYGRDLVDSGTLTASVEVPANAGLALELLHRFWTRATPLPLRSFTEPRPYPA